MPIFEVVAETIGSTVMEVLFWASIKPQGACLIAAGVTSIAFCTTVASPGSWILGIGMTLIASAIGFAIGWRLDHAFRGNRPARIATCVLAGCVTFGAIGWLIIGA